MRRLPALGLPAVLLLAGPALAQYTPPTVYAPPRTFEHTPSLPAVPIPAPLVVVPGKAGEKPSVVVPPPPIPAPGPPLAADQIVEEFGRCLAYGTTSILECLRQNHSSVSIRRLEACLRSETIPEDATEVHACLAAGHW